MTQLEIEEFTELMEAVKCSECKQYETGCLPEEVLQCTVQYIVEFLRTMNSLADSLEKHGL